jgi:hypothetical protein
VNDKVLCDMIILAHPSQFYDPTTDASDQLFQTGGEFCRTVRDRSDLLWAHPPRSKSRELYIKINHKS